MGQRPSKVHPSTAVAGSSTITNSFYKNRTLWAQHLLVIYNSGNPFYNLDQRRTGPNQSKCSSRPQHDVLGFLFSRVVMLSREPESFHERRLAITQIQISSKENCIRVVPAFNIFCSFIRHKNSLVTGMHEFIILQKLIPERPYDIFFWEVWVDINSRLSQICKLQTLDS